MFINLWSITLLKKAIDYLSPKVNFNRLIEYFLIIDPMYMYVCVCVCVYTYIHIYMCVCVDKHFYFKFFDVESLHSTPLNSFTFLTEPPKRKPIVCCMGKTIDIF